MIRVLAPGFLTTVQDLGRPGWAHLGVSASGAADALSLRAANLLVGNPEGAPALEMTLVGGAFAFERAAVVALAGSDFGAGRPLWQPFEMRAGEVLRFAATRTGARCYLAVRGGIGVPLVMGSASTHLLTGLGGFQGRALRAGDVLSLGEAAIRPLAARAAVPPPLPAALRVTPGPQAEWFGGSLYSAEWLVTEESDRMGLRLRGPALESHAGAMLTEGVSLGAIQVPPDGQPIILFVEHQTTGGYPKTANVVSADLHAVGQLRPRARVRFERVSLDAALGLLREQENWLHALR